MAEQFGEKSHDATPFRRQKAREQGQVAKSQDLTSALLLVGALMALMYWGEEVAQFFAEFTHKQFGEGAWLTADPNFVVGNWQYIATRLSTTVLPLLAVLTATAVLVNLGQVGFMFLPEKLAFDASRVSPFKGFQRLFSLSNGVRLGFGLFKISVVAIVASWSLWMARDRIMALSAQSVAAVGVTLVELVIWTSLKIALALLILALLDYWYQWWKQEQDMKMTTQEVREELKSLQGDPQVIARRRAVQRQLAMSRLRSTVPEADVVVINPTELAVAIRYDPETMAAPIVVAKGADHAAARIRHLAEEHDVPIVERTPLARALFAHVDVGQPVPNEQYAAVAEVLRYVYELQGKSLPTAPPTAA